MNFSSVKVVELLVVFIVEFIFLFFFCSSGVLNPK